MKKDDSRSQIIRFSVQLGPASKLASLNIPAELKVENQEGAELQDEPATIELEGQGIMVYDRSSGGASHVSCVSDAGGGINANVRFRQCG
jgi:serine/threonine-protein kinase RIM15